MIKHGAPDVAFAFCCPLPAAAQLLWQQLQCLTQTPRLQRHFLRAAASFRANSVTPHSCMNPFVSQPRLPRPVSMPRSLSLLWLSALGRSRQLSRSLSSHSLAPSTFAVSRFFCGSSGSRSLGRDNTPLYFLLSVWRRCVSLEFWQNCTKGHNNSSSSVCHDHIRVHDTSTKKVNTKCHGSMSTPGAKTTTKKVDISSPRTNAINT